MEGQDKVKKRNRRLVLMSLFLLGLVVFAIAYPMAASGGSLAGY